MSGRPLAVVLLLMAAALAAALALYIYRRRSTTRGDTLLVLVLLAMTGWALAYAVELAVAGSAGEFFWSRVKLVAALTLSALWLALALHHTGRWFSRLNLAVLAVPTVLFLALVWTGVIWRNRGSEAAGAPGTPMVGWDLWSWVIVTYAHGLVLLGAALLVSHFLDSQHLYRKQSAVLVLAVLLPWAANASNLARVVPDLDPTPFAFPLTVLVLAWGIWRYRLLDVVPVHRGYIFESITDGVVVLDPRNRILDLNPAAERIIGTTASQAVGQSISALVSNRTGWLIEGRGAGLLGGDREGDKEYAEISTGEGEKRRHYGLVLSRLGEANDRRSNRLLLLRDITERKRAEGRLDRLAHYDLLTNLPNRRLLHDRLKQAIAQARRRRTVVALLFIDMDRFKHVNDTLGHEVGDLLLMEVADRMTACVREADTVSRLAGDEFVVVLNDVTRASDVARVAQRLHEALTEPYELKGHELNMTASMGISLYPVDGENGTDLLEKADAAMYRAKTLGKNRFEFYTDGSSPGSPERPGLGGELELALERGEFAVYYQPIVSMETGRVFGAEALVRWEHPERGLLAPAQFIQVAEETGIIVPIGLWVMRESCIRASRWRDWRGSDSPPLTVCVNLSARQLEHPDIVRDTERILAETGLDADGLLLEVSEAAVMRDAWSAAAIMGRLKELGVRLAIDDFGTGYSSLPHLNRLPVDYLKIDRSLVDGLEEDSEKKVAAAAMVSLAHALDMGVIGEGVENSRQLAHLKLIGCDLVQGHYLGEPLPPEEAERAISFIDLYR